MKIINVKLKNGEYDINIGTGAYGKLMNDLSDRKGKVFLVADSNAISFHGHVILDAIGGEPAGVFFIDGEKDKNIKTVSSILEQAASAGISRSDCFVSFGGGVCGDITGFCAAIYMRGIDYYQVPTTLLSQVDSSVGGKTGIDLIEGKNLVGAFKQPAGVYIDAGVLRTLPGRELNQGKAEMIKTALIKDVCLFSRFENSEIVSEENIIRCIEIKLDFVKGDEFDAGKRMMLNFGHTIAHALETKTGYGVLPHGEAVSIGMAAMNSIFEKAGLSPEGSTKRITDILTANSLPVKLDIPLKELAQIMKNDKKNINGKLNCVYLKEIGKADLHMLTIDELVAMEGQFE